MIGEGLIDSPDAAKRFGPGTFSQKGCAIPLSATVYTRLRGCDFFLYPGLRVLHLGPKDLSRHGVIAQALSRSLGRRLQIDSVLRRVAER
jgi:hypothetical protein